MISLLDLNTACAGQQRPESYRTPSLYARFALPLLAALLLAGCTGPSSVPIEDRTEPERSDWGSGETTTVEPAPAPAPAPIEDHSNARHSSKRPGETTKAIPIPIENRSDSPRSDKSPDEASEPAPIEDRSTLFRRNDKRSGDATKAKAKDAPKDTTPDTDAAVPAPIEDRSGFRGVAPTSKSSP